MCVCVHALHVCVSVCVCGGGCSLIAQKWRSGSLSYAGTGSLTIRDTLVAPACVKRRKGFCSLLDLTRMQKVAWLVGLRSQDVPGRLGCIRRTEGSYDKTFRS